MHAPPLRVVVIDDDELVTAGLTAMFEPYSERVQVEPAVRDGLARHADIALYDTFGRAQQEGGDLVEVVANPSYGKVVVYTWNFQPWLAAEATELGAAGYLSKSLSTDELLDALLDIHAGKTVVSPSGSGETPDWPGRDHGLTARESEVLTLITQGHSNADIADLTCLSINSIKSYIRSCYRKIEVSSRSRAVLWGIEHGMRPERAISDAGEPEVTRTP